MAVLLRPRQPTWEQYPVVSMGAVPVISPFHVIVMRSIHRYAPIMYIYFKIAVF